MLTSTYQIRGPVLNYNFMLARLLGFTLGNRGGLHGPKIDSIPKYIRNASLLLKGPKCCVLEGSPHYRGGTVVQFGL